jgi:hypothetical protein
MPGQRPPWDSCRRTAPARRIRALERLHAAQQPVRKPVHGCRGGHLPQDQPQAAIIDNAPADARAKPTRKAARGETPSH